MQEALQELARRDGRFSIQAYLFLFESLDTAIQLAGKGQAEGPDRHITGQDLLMGMRSFGERSFGPMAAQVWRSWGVHETLDWGRIVFLLVEQGLLAKRDEDHIDDFRAGFDFDAAFVNDYNVPIPSNLD